MKQGCSLASFDKNLYRNELKSICVSLVIQANFCWVKISNYQLDGSHTGSPDAATMPFPKTTSQRIIPTS